jgi:hypothetical protein
MRRMCGGKVDASILMKACEICHDTFNIDELQYVSDASPDPPWYTEEILMCQACLKKHLDKKWGSPGQVQV